MSSGAATLSSTSTPRRTSPPVRLVLLSMDALRHVVFVSLAAVVLLSAWVLVPLDGRSYYSTPLAVRGYHAAHALLRPSGVVGQTLGMVGTLLMLVPFAYMLAKRLPSVRMRANLKAWLEIHIFCGIVGPALITYHTAFKFNGLVSVAYWSMVLVALSGFVGRYLYVRIPRTIRGVEVGEAELATKLNELREHLQWVTPPSALETMEAFERRVLEDIRHRGVWRRLTTGDRWLKRQLTAHRDDLVAHAVPAETAEHVVELVGEQARLTGKLTGLHRTKQVFDVWHVLHLPLVYVMLAIVTLHVALVLYLGYVPFRW